MFKKQVTKQKRTVVALGDNQGEMMLSGDTYPPSTAGGAGMASQSSFTRFDHTPIFLNDERDASRDASPVDDPKKNSLNPALNRRIKAPKKIEDPRKQAVLKVKKSLGAISSIQPPIRSNSQLSNV